MAEDRNNIDKDETKINSENNQSMGNPSNSNQSNDDEYEKIYKSDSVKTDLERLIKGCVQEKGERLELVIMFPLSRQRKLFLWLLEI